jgi:hypothetical protein
LCQRSETPEDKPEQTYEHTCQPARASSCQSWYRISAGLYTIASHHGLRVTSGLHCQPKRGRRLSSSAKIRGTRRNGVPAMCERTLGGAGAGHAQRRWVHLVVYGHHSLNVLLEWVWLCLLGDKLTRLFPVNLRTTHFAGLHRQLNPIRQGTAAFVLAKWLVVHSHGPNTGSSQEVQTSLMVFTESCIFFRLSRKTINSSRRQLNLSGRAQLCLCGPSARVARHECRYGCLVAECLCHYAAS